MSMIFLNDIQVNIKVFPYVRTVIETTQYTWSLLESDSNNRFQTVFIVKSLLKRFWFYINVWKWLQFTFDYLLRYVISSV